MAVSSKNLAAGMILPRATPARSGTRHSISVTPLAAAQVLASLAVAIGAVFAAWNFGFFLGIGCAFAVSIADTERALSGP